MQRVATKQTRAPNAAEKRFLKWTKEQPCIVTGLRVPVIAHHCWGSAAKRKVDLISTLIGPWAVIPLSKTVDDVITLGSRRRFEQQYGPQIRYLMRHIASYPDRQQIPLSVLNAFIGMAKEAGEWHPE